MDASSWTAIGIAAGSVLFAAIGYLFKRNETLHTRSQDALATQSQALAVVLDKVQGYTSLEQRTTKLEITTARLAARLGES